MGGGVIVLLKKRLGSDILPKGRIAMRLYWIWSAKDLRMISFYLGIHPLK